MQLYIVIIPQIVPPIPTYYLPESGTQRQQRWQRWHRWHPDAQRTIGTWSETRTKPLRLWNTVSTRKSRKTTLTASNEGEHRTQLSYRRFLHKGRQQSCTPKEPKDSRKLSAIYSGINTVDFFLILWGACIKKIQLLGYKQKYDPSIERGNMVLLVHFFLSWVLAWSCLSCAVPVLLTAVRAAPSLFLAPSILTTGLCTVFMLWEPVSKWPSH